MFYDYSKENIIIHKNNVSDRYNSLLILFFGRIFIIKDTLINLYTLLCLYKML